MKADGKMRSQADEIPVGTVPFLDFESHPAFSRSSSELPKDREAEQVLAEIEAACDDIAHRPGLEAEDFRAEFDDSIQPKFYRLADLAAGHPAMSLRFRVYVRRSIGQAIAFLFDYLQSAQKTPDSRMSQLSGTAAAHLESLRRDGFCRFDLGPALATRVRRSTWWERRVLRRRALSAPGRHCAIALDDYSSGSLAIQNALERHGILDIASAYLRRRMQFLYAALDHAHDKQNWYRDCYGDAGLPTSRTAYMHFDADSDVLKAMLYLNDVGPENGAFRYVRGSHLWNRSPVRCALEKGFDVQQTRTFEMEEDHLDYKLGYYRPRYKLPEYRRGLLLLPKILRGSTHFGDDILDGTPLSETLLRQEEVFVGRAGTFVLFDGSRGIHRGSQAERGERWAVQIALRAASSDAPAPRLRVSVRRRLQYQVSRGKGLLRDLGGR